jgi:hypothetical protein
MVLLYTPKCNFIYVCKENSAFPRTDFHETHEISTALFSDLLYRISPKSAHIYGV